MPQVATTLESLLAPIAKDIQQKSAQLLKTRTKLTNEYLSRDDLRHEALTATFEAFHALGGDPDNHGAFDWTARQDELVDEAKRTFQRWLVGKQSVFGDVRARLQTRPNRSMNSQDAWDSWYGATESAPPKSARPSGAKRPAWGGNEYVTEAPQERELRERDLGELFNELRNILSGEELRWMKAVYWEGKSIAECGRTLVSSGEYDDERRATNYLYKVLERARKRAKALLSSRWNTLLQEAQ